MTRLLVLLIISMTLTLGCSSDDNTAEMMDNPQQEDPMGDDPDGSDDPDGGDDPTMNGTTLNVTVNLPAGEDIDLDTTTLLAFTNEYTVDANGASTIDYNTNSQVLTYLLDENDNILLMGFLSTEKSELSISSSAEVLLYFGLGTPFVSSFAREVFHEEIQDTQGFTDFVAALETLYAGNILLFAENAFLPPLTDYLGNLITKDELNILNTIDITNGIQSGMFLDNDNIDRISITNQYYRRGHAFIYKTRFRDMGGQETILNAVIEGSETADSEEAILPANANTTSNRGLKGFRGAGSEPIAYKTPEIELSLEASESEATYQVRVVGPGNNQSSLELTNAETEKLEELLTDFMALDVLLPVFLDLIGHGNAFENNQNSSITDLSQVGSLEGYRTQVNAAIMQAPGTFDALRAGDITEAIRTFFAYARTETVGQDIFSALRASVAAFNPQSYYVQQNESIVNTLLRLDKGMVLINTILDNNEYGELFAGFNNSTQLENWKVVVQQDDVDLLPDQASTLTFRNNTFSVDTDVVLEDGQSLSYQWSTSGTYGTLNDGAGNTGTSFESDSETVTYRSTTPASQLGASNPDTITVTIFLVQANGTQDRLGEDTSTINVQPQILEMRPEGAILEGGQSVQLYIQDRLGNNPIVSNSSVEYQVRWRAGNYGKFNGRLNQVSTFRNSVNYEITDFDVDEDQDNIVAGIYFRLRGATGWIFQEEVQGSVVVDNRANVKRTSMIRAEIALDTFVNPFYNFSVQNFYTFTPVEGAVEYLAKIVDRAPDLNPSVIGSTLRWKPGDANEPLLNEAGDYDIFRRVFIGRQSGQPIDEGFKSESLAAAQGVRGTVQIIAFLEE